MPRDGSGELRRVADALFRALDELGPAGPPESLDLSSCDALTPDTDGLHLTLQGKLCAQRLYTMGSRHDDYDQDSVIVLVSTLDMVVRAITRRQRSDSDELRRLGDAWLHLQGLAMELDRIYTTGE
ncbi:hypothetical protein [Pseudonocardia endophytica]|uniref:Uncharacterized protein n=1 Tax=Pseudonocardia endophytica TaxID=401976 RepID=A0A4R1HF49_PSEEN|nr:hypothetical protein [Pseudonocardia endophytica]TCK20757.1 hypothetical protein EV378_4720 [Pseudonocardia endophytica]